MKLLAVTGLANSDRSRAKGPYMPSHVSPHLSPNLDAMIGRILKKEPKSFNTDWDGTMAMEGLHALINRGDTPTETSSTAMCVAVIKEAMDEGWLPNTYEHFLRRGWQFVQKHVRGDGTVDSVYTGWAVPAEKGEMIMGQSGTRRSWIYDVILYAAEEMLL